MLNEFRENLANNKELLLKVKVFPLASRNEIKGKMVDGTIKIGINAPAEDNKANKALIKYLADELGVRRYQVEIISGALDRFKVIRVGR
ncbi:MAG TPA: DUF167 domain-containing protein [Candidatus Saccharimonadales bacterium]|nr:DUF167 domain-containing protein [Candidatus Saccharimonadales bacterium]